MCIYGKILRKVALTVTSTNGFLYNIIIRIFYYYMFIIYTCIILLYECFIIICVQIYLFTSAKSRFAIFSIEANICLFVYTLYSLYWSILCLLNVVGFVLFLTHDTIELEIALYACVKFFFRKCFTQKQTSAPSRLCKKSLPKFRTLKRGTFSRVWGERGAKPLIYRVRRELRFLPAIQSNYLCNLRNASAAHLFGDPTPTRPSAPFSANLLNSPFTPIRT